jgi:hypothetical protein
MINTLATPMKAGCALDERALATLFTKGRIAKAFLDHPVERETLERMRILVKAPNLCANWRATTPLCKRDISF